METLFLQPETEARGFSPPSLLPQSECKRRCPRQKDQIMTYSNTEIRYQLLLSKYKPRKKLMSPFITGKIRDSSRRARMKKSLTGARQSL
ncbi:hypothetical protein QQ054_07190 [Oscillatoria amoena NRMC-F 0135]|nr:hypothetical protein [Oscillatoria amoena NRMC-F 0135]